MKRIILSAAILALAGCTSITVEHNGETVSVIAETSRLLG